MRGKRGFTLIDILLASFLFLFCLIVLYTVFNGAYDVYDFNRRRMQAIDSLFLTLDKIKKYLREAEKLEDPSSFPFPLPSDSLVFTEEDGKSFALFTLNNSIFIIQESSLEPEMFAPGISISASYVSPATCQIILCQKWRWKKEERKEQISSAVNLRNWGRK